MTSLADTKLRILQLAKTTQTARVLRSRRGYKVATLGINKVQCYWKSLEQLERCMQFLLFTLLIESALVNM